MADRDKPGKELPSSSRDHRIRPVDPVPPPPPPPPPNDPNRGRWEHPPSPHPGRDRIRGIYDMPPIHEARRPSPHHSRDRRIVIELPGGPEGRHLRPVRGRVPTPYSDPNLRMNLEPAPPAVAGPSYDMSQGIIAAGAVGSSALVPSNPLQKSHSDYGFSTLPSGSRRTFRTFIRSVRQRLRGFVPFLRHVEPREARKGLQPSTDESLSVHPSLESTSINIPEDDGSDGSDSETDEHETPVSKHPLFSEESLSIEDRSDSDRSRTTERLVDRPVLRSSEDIANEDSPDPSLDRSLTPDTPVQLVPYSPEVEIAREDDAEQAEDHGHVNPSGALSAQKDVQAELYRISLSSPVNMQIEYEESGHVTTCIRCEPARYVLDEDDVVSDTEESRSDDEGNYF